MEPLQPGDPATVGRYRVGGRLGQGGMGRVYWGRSASGRPVAIKIVHAHLATEPAFRHRFAHEVDAARRVGGFHTAPVVDADPDGDPPWLVTAYVAGPSLADAVRRTGAFDVPTLRVLGAGLAEALEAIHAVGLVHRDLKPANILLTDDGPRVIDFGIARALEPGDGPALTATGAAIGTPRHMAPEQFGDQQITGATDVFAWGTVMCHATGTHPFGEGSAATVVGAILTRPPALDGVPPSLLEVVSAALDKDPARRPTPAQLLDALSDGSSSDGWLPGPVRAMLPEHTLPDVTRPISGPGSTTRTGTTETASTQVLDTRQIDRGRPTTPPYGARQPHRPPPAQPTQRWTGPPPDQTPPPPGDARPARRGPALFIGVALTAAVLIVAGIGYALSTSNGSPAPAPAAAPPSAATVSTAVEPTETPAGAPVAVEPERFVGNWQTVEGQSRIIAVSIDPITDVSSSVLGMSITVVEAPECAGANGVASSTGSPSGAVLATSWVITCENSGDTLTFDERYTYDPTTDRLTDSQNLVYAK